jgi:hypothetical protein
MMHPAATFTKALVRRRDFTLTVALVGGLDARWGRLLDTGDQVSPGGMRDGENQPVGIG